MNSACIICNSITYSVATKFGFFHCCTNCEFIYKDYDSMISPKDELKIYNYHNNSIDDPSYVSFLKKFLNEAVLDFTNKGKKGLDFGSGPSPVLSEIMKRDYNWDMEIYDLFYSPEKIYRNKKYDLITSTEVMEHLKNPLDYFVMFKDLLVDNGILAIMTLFHPNNVELFSNWHYIRDKSHISFFSLKTFEYIANIVGLEILYTNSERYITFKKNDKMKTFHHRKNS